MSSASRYGILTEADHPTAIVVGAGVFGASTALALIRRGWRITLLEKASAGHDGASSGGETRLWRSSHGGNRTYTRLAWAAREGWRQLEAETGRKVLVETGLVWFAREQHTWETGSEEAAHELGIPLERLTLDQVAGLFPSLRTDDLRFGLWEPNGGILRARTAVRTLVDLAGRHGAVVREGVMARPDGAAVRVGGQTLHADRVVWACGPWLQRLFDGLDVTVTQQDTCFFSVGPQWHADRVPAWADFGGAAYGTGDLDGHGFKCASDVQGPPFDPDRDDRVPLPRHLDAARQLLAHRFPALAGAPLAGARTCQYTTTRDTEFILSPTDDERVWIVGGGSGHGFKHGPALGAYVADLLAGISSPDPRFGLGPRASSGSLRTAGHEAR